MKNPGQAREAVVSWIEEHAPEFFPYSEAIWSLAELGCEEHRSSRLLCRLLHDHGFAVEAGPAGLPTAFLAAWGQGRPVIGFNCEYDSLPGLSQQVKSQKAPLVEGAPGHGCGHNLLGVGSVMAAVALRRWLAATGRPGAVVVLGCPAEELCIGKPFLARDGFFKGFDAILDWHPFWSNSANHDSCNAYFSLKYHFQGRTAHGNAPWLGRSAADSALLMGHALELLREHIPPGNPNAPNTFNYTFSDLGPEYPNVVPDRGTLWVVGRIQSSDQMVDLVRRIGRCAEAAALATETSWSEEFITASHERIPNQTLSALVHRNLTEIGPPRFDAAEHDFARQIQRASGVAECGLSEEVLPLSGGFSGVSDNSEFSWFAPFAMVRVTAGPAGFGWHNWQVTASAGSSIGAKAMTTAAKVLAASAVELVLRPEILAEAAGEFRRRLAGGEYCSLIPAGSPPPVRISREIMDKYRPEMNERSPLVEPGPAGEEAVE